MVKRVVFSTDKRIYVRRALFAVLIILTAAFQNTQWMFSDIRPMLLVPLCVCIAMHEKSMGGLAFGVFCGALWDASSARGDGFFSVTLACVGYLSGVLITYFMRNNILASLVISGGACFAVNFIYWLVFVLLKNYEGATGLLFSYYLPCAFLSIIFTFLYYYLIRLIVEATTVKT